MPHEIDFPRHRSDAVAMQVLARQQLFPAVGPPIHVNRPHHEGDTPLHSHDFLEIAIVASGHALHRTIHGVTTITTGDALLLRSGDWHAYEKCHDLRLVNCCIGIDLVTGPLAWLKDDPRIAPLLGLAHGPVDRVRLDAGSRADCLAVLDRILVMQADRPEQRRVELIGQLLLFFAALGQGAVHGEARSGSPNQAVTKVMEVLLKDMSRNWSLDEMAASVDLDPSYLVRLFRRNTGLPPIAWLARMRCERAAILLLTTGRSVADVGVEVGWHDANYFSRRFHHLFGQNPSAYRRQLPMKPVIGTIDDWIQW